MYPRDLTSSSTTLELPVSQLTSWRFGKWSGSSEKMTQVSLSTISTLQDDTTEHTSEAHLLVRWSLASRAQRTPSLHSLGCHLKKRWDTVREEIPFDNATPEKRDSLFTLCRSLQLRSPRQKNLYQRREIASPTVVNGEVLADDGGRFLQQILISAASDRRTQF